LNSGKVYTQNDKEKDESQLEDNDEDIPEVALEAEICEHERNLKELEEKLSLEEAALLNEEARIIQEEDYLLQNEKELKDREEIIKMNEIAKSNPKVLLKSDSFLEPPPSYEEITDLPPSFEEIKPQLFPELDEAVKKLNNSLKE